MARITIQEKKYKEISADARLIKERKRNGKAEQYDSAYSFNK